MNRFADTAPDDLAHEVDAARAVLRDAIPVSLDDMNPTQGTLIRIAQAAEEALRMLDDAVGAPYCGYHQPSLPFDDL